MQYLVVGRHGLSTANLSLSTSDCGLYYSTSGSDPLVPLVEPEGFKQAAEMGRRLSRLFPRRRPLLRAFHSDYLRVTQTLDGITDKLTYPLERVCDLRLRKRDYGEFWNLTYEGVKQLHPQHWQRYLSEGDLHFRPPGGENYFDLFTRIDDFIDAEVMTSSENLLIVTHSVDVLAFQRRLEGLSDEELVRRYEESTLPNAHMIIWCRQNQDAAWERCDEEFIGVHSPGL